MLGQHANILAALAQRRQHDRKHEHAMVEVLAKRSLPHLLLEIAVRRHHHAHVHRKRARRLPRARSRPPRARAAASPASPSGMSPISSRKSVPRCACSNFPMCRAAAPVNDPFSWPNSSDSISSAGIAAQFSEMNGAAVARAFFVQRARDQLLARARFAANADARFARGHLLDLRHHLAHRRARPHDLVPPEPPLQIAVFLLEAREAQRVLDREQQLFRRNRLLEKIDGAQPRGAHGHFDGGLAGHHHRRARLRRYSSGLRAARCRRARASPRRKGSNRSARPSRARARARRCRRPSLRVPPGEMRERATQACSRRRR